ncbi:MAG TPA: hypothetical protein VJL81_03855 [Solirubrobacterales bacterium]|nr:hypothetical protein [Solirubrobacterales bacterium]
MRTRTTIEFQRTIATELATGDIVPETVNAEVAADGETFRVELPEGGRWECDQAELRALLD